MAAPSLKWSSAILALALLPGPAAAQLWVDAIGSTALPPGGFAESNAVYSLLGARFHSPFKRNTLDMSLYGGTGARTEDGRWLNGSALVGRVWGRGDASIRLGFEGTGLRYFQPFSYTLAIATTRAGYERSFGKTDLGISAEFSGGRYWTAYTTSTLLGGELDVDTSGTLSLPALTMEATRNFPAALLSAALRLPRANGRFFLNPTITAARVVNGWEWTLHATALNTQQAGGGLRLARQLGPSLRLSAHIEHQVRDLLLGTPANFGGGITLSWKFSDPAANAAERARLVTVGSRSADGTLVEFKLERTQAGKVELVGSFTNWDAQAMTRAGKVWKATVRLPPGSHQFAFLVDGEWFIPAGAPGVVDDGFGRKNATVVIERM